MPRPLTDHLQIYRGAVVWEAPQDNQDKKGRAKSMKMENLSEELTAQWLRQKRPHCQPVDHDRDESARAYFRRKTFLRMSGQNSWKT